MTGIFIKILNMSLTSLPIILCVILVRAFLKKAPRVIPCILWALVAVSLVCPFRFESRISAVPEREPVKESVIHSSSPKVESGIPVIDSAVNSVIDERFEPEQAEGEKDQKTPLEKVTQIASLVWCGGIVAMLVYCAVSYLRIYAKVRASLRLKGNVYTCDYISSPFILGVIRPKIYLPTDIPSDAAEYVIAHERAHIKRLDFIWKPLGFLLLSVYWFNPFVWIGYILLCRDIELACDEKVAKGLDIQQMKSYSEALLVCSVPRRMIAACPVAFGEVGVKTRIKALVNYKKPAFWIIIISVLICIVVGAVFLTVRPKDKEFSSDEMTIISTTSDCEGVSAKIVSAKINSNDPYLEIEWKNETDDEYLCGEAFYVYKMVNGEWENMRLHEDYVYNDIGYMISPKSNLFQKDFSKKYYLSDIKMNIVGKYRFESRFSRVGGAADEKYTVTIDFEVSTPREIEYLKGSVIERNEPEGNRVRKELSFVIDVDYDEAEYVKYREIQIKTRSKVDERINRGTRVIVGYEGDIEGGIIEDKNLLLIECYDMLHYGEIKEGDAVRLNEHMSFTVGNTRVIESFTCEEAYGMIGDTYVEYPGEGNCFIGVDIAFENNHEAYDVVGSARLLYKEKGYFEHSGHRDIFEGGRVAPLSEKKFTMIFEVPLEILWGADDNTAVQVYFNYNDSPNTIFSIPIGRVYENENEYYNSSLSISDLSKYTGINLPKETHIDYLAYRERSENEKFWLNSPIDVAISIPIEYSDKVLGDTSSVHFSEIEKQAYKGALFPDAKDKAPLKYEDVEKIYIVDNWLGDDEATADIDEGRHTILVFIYTCKKEKELLLYMELFEQVDRAYEQRNH